MHIYNLSLWKHGNDKHIYNPEGNLFRGPTPLQQLEGTNT